MKVILTFPTGERMQYTVKNEAQANEIFRQAQERFKKPYYQPTGKKKYRTVKMEIIRPWYVKLWKSFTSYFKQWKATD